MAASATMSENKQKMLRGELYHAFTPELTTERQRCSSACQRFNSAVDPSRRERVRLWRDIINDQAPLPAKLPDQEKDDAQFADDPWVEAPVHIDYGTNIKLSSNVFINFNCVFLDTCPITVGSRTLFGPNVSVYSGTHPLDPEVRNGTRGPELGKDISIGSDCWIGGNVTILPGVTIGDGATVGAGSVVTKDIPAFHVAAGNPARIIRKIKTNLDPEQYDVPRTDVEGAENPMADLA